MALDAGNLGYEDGRTITLDTGGNAVGPGESVTFDADGNLTQAAAGDRLVGVTADVNTSGDGKISVHVAGLVIAVELSQAVEAGYSLEADGAGAFQWNGNDTDGDLGGPGEPFALESGASGDVILACFR